MKIKEYFNCKDYNFWYFLFIVLFITDFLLRLIVIVIGISSTVGIALDIFDLLVIEVIMVGWLIDLFSGRKENNNRVSTFGRVSFVFFCSLLFVVGTFVYLTTV